MDLAALGIAALGFAFALFVWRGSRPPYWDERLAVRPFRVAYWLLAWGCILVGLLGAIDMELMGYGMLLFAVAGVWIAGLLLVMMIAPRYAARILYYPLSVSFSVPGAPRPSLQDMEADARKGSYLMLAIATVGGAGYYLWTRWLGLWTILVAYLVVLSFVVYKALRPAASDMSAPKGRAGSEQ